MCRCYSYITLVSLYVLEALLQSLVVLNTLLDEAAFLFVGLFFISKPLRCGFDNDIFKSLLVVYLSRAARGVIYTTTLTSSIRSCPKMLTFN